MGPQAQTGAAKQWSGFKDFLFDTDKPDIRSNETSKVSEIAAYLKQNPSVQVGIDGFADPPRRAGSDRRVEVLISNSK